MNRWSPRPHEAQTEVSHPGVFRAERKPRRSSFGSPKASPVNSPKLGCATSPKASPLSSPKASPFRAGTKSVPAPLPEFYGFKPSCKESPTLSDSTTSPVWSARSSECSQESNSRGVQRTPGVSANLGADFSDAESLVPRSNSTSSLDDYCEFSPRSMECNASQVQMPMAYPAPDAVPWASERLYPVTRRRQIGFPATLGLSMDPTEHQVPATTHSLSAGLWSPSTTLIPPTTRAISESLDMGNSFTSLDDHRDVPGAMSLDSEAVAQVTTHASPTHRARLQTKKARDMTETYGLELRSLDNEMQDLMKDLLDLKEHVTSVKPQLIVDN